MYKLEIQEKESKVKRIQDFISKEVNSDVCQLLLTNTGKKCRSLSDCV